MARSDRKLDQEIEAFLNEVRSGFNYLIAFFLSFLNKIKRKLYCIVRYNTHSHSIGFCFQSIPNIWSYLLLQKKYALLPKN